MFLTDCVEVLEVGKGHSSLPGFEMQSNRLTSSQPNCLGFFVVQLLLQFWISFHSDQLQ